MIRGSGAGRHGMTATTSTTDPASGGDRQHVTRTVGAGDDTITYDVHGDLSEATPERPALFVYGSPMEASAFGTLVAYLADRPVVTYDPRGAGRNPAGTGPLRPEQHAADLHAVIGALGVAPVDVFGTSGGGVNTLALLAAHPDDVRRAVVHEPPIVTGLPDAEVALAACADVAATYERLGAGPAMARFIALVMHDGELPADYLERPAPDPARFGLSAEDDGSRTHPLMRNFPACNVLEPDLEVLRSLGDRLTVVAGATSGETLAARGARAVAAAVGVPLTLYPGDHGGFMGGEHGQVGEPEAFAAALRRTLDR